MNYTRMARLGPVLVLMVLIVLVFQGVAVADVDIGAVLGAITEVRSAHEQSQEPAQAGNYDLTWWTVDVGGATFSTGGGYSLGATTGQPDAAVWSGGGYRLAGGFWGEAAVGFRIYLPLVLRSY